MADRTEAPTPRRLEDARSEGQVARSLELNTASILLVGALLLGGPGKALLDGMKASLTDALSALPGATITDSWLRDWLITELIRVVPSLGVVMVGLLVTGVSVTLVQTGFLWTSKRIGFDFKRVNPLTGLQRIFSTQGLVELGRALLKLGLVGWVAYTSLQGESSELLRLSQMDFLSALQDWSNLALSLAIRVGGAYVFLAAADYAYQRWKFMRSLRMSKEEVKEDLKRSEGDPFLRGRIRAQQRRLARSRMMANVHKADVVITNPTHFAVAIAYDPQQMHAPRVLAKGAYAVAQRIVELARSSGVPVIQNIPLARALYRSVEVDQEITPELYLAVAEVLAYVFRLNGRSPHPAQP
ncbi:MAG: flagellar biosynthesis protein FlhB [Chloroflexi bacterium]|nr:flagellar biosynthesis protein FlhB [Chloroflexota bacterium]